MQISLEVDVRENFHKEMPIDSNCLVSETIRTIPEGNTMITPSTTQRYLRANNVYLVGQLLRSFSKGKKKQEKAYSVCQRT